MPAAAVIPAPVAYIKVVAVRKLVVGFLPRAPDPPPGQVFGVFSTSSWGRLLYLTVWSGNQGFYFEEIRVFHAGCCLECISME